MTAKKTLTQTAMRENNIALAKALVERQVMSQKDAKAILLQMKSDGKDQTFEDYLVENDILTEDVVLETKAGLWNVPFIDLQNYEIDPEVLELLPAKVANEFKLFPLFRIDDTLLLAMSDPKDVKAIDTVTRLTQLEISPALSSSTAIHSAIETYYGTQKNLDMQVSSEEIKDILDIIEEETVPEEQESASTQDLERQAEEAPVVKMTNMILTQAIAEGASDVHINPEEEQLRVRFRVDGVLRDSLKLPKNTQQAIISRIKILSNLDIAEHRIPQDGQMRIRLKDGRNIDIRVSTLPSAFGENVVMRILDKNAALLQLENLGFEEKVFELTTGLLQNSYGIILVTGPTGSGKTTTLYAALNRLNSVEKNIITLEDPIEYRLPLIRQSQVNHKAGMTFSKGLRAILRQDPDIVMVGEIRDSETANIAVQAALTGHLVLSTLHTNDAAGAITRLAEMDIEAFLISSSVLGVMAQRLVRRICSECKEEVEAYFDFPKKFLDTFYPGSSKESLRVYKGRGCKHCRNTGYRGRASLIEVLPVTEKIKGLILKSVPADEIKKAAIEEGMSPLVYDGYKKVLKGVTTFEEVMRVTNI